MAIDESVDFTLSGELEDAFRLETQCIDPSTYELIRQLELRLGQKFLEMYSLYLDGNQIQYWSETIVNVLTPEDALVVVSEFSREDIFIKDYLERLELGGRIYQTYDVFAYAVPNQEKVGNWNLVENAYSLNEENSVDFFKGTAGFIIREGRIPVLLDNFIKKGAPNIEYLNFEGSPSIYIAATIIHEKLHGTFKSPLPLPIEEIVVRFYTKELFRQYGWQMPYFGPWEESIEFFSQLMERCYTPEEMNSFFFGNLNDKKKEALILSDLKEVFCLERLQNLMPDIRWWTRDFDTKY